jgi:hypothetical protein
VDEEDAGEEGQQQQHETNRAARLPPHLHHAAGRVNGSRRRT